MVAHSCDLGMLEAEADDLEFQARLGYIIKSCLKRGVGNSMKLSFQTYFSLPKFLKKLYLKKIITIL